MVTLETAAGWRVQVAEATLERLGEERLAAEVERLVDPGSALETVHWGRNYLYRVELDLGAGPVEAVVKQFRAGGRWEQLRRRVKGSKAERSWRVARALRELELATPEPLLCIESEAVTGPTFYVCRHLGDALEARYWMRALNADDEEAFGWLDVDAVLRDLGRLVRRLHDHGIWHRDMTSGNVLLVPGREAPRPDLYLVDLNRARLGRRIGPWRSAKELGRMPLFRPVDQERYLEGYWEPRPVPGWYRLLYRQAHRNFLAKNRSKQRLRGGLRTLAENLRPRRRPHAHIPPAQDGAGARDKIVWDALSDQPHQHASRLEKGWVRLRDAPSHLRALGVAAAALRRARPRFEALRRQPPEEIRVEGIGIGLTVDPQGPGVQELLAAVDGLGVSHALLRLYPWQEDHDAAETLARELAGRGLELTFAVPQNRELVKDPERWQRAVEEIAERFLSFGRHVQIGQAINRSKWGVWRAEEYVELFARAARALRAVRDDVELLGPAVIDFEPHATAAYLNLDRPELRFDALASLLYVDRRGAPENLQLGLDTVGKALLLKALAETSRNCPSGRSWITEVNWPLWEGPHSPAGRDVSVDEELQASYLVRYYLLALCRGRAERVFWWQLVARGYGLMDAGGEGLRRRPGFRALATLVDRLAGSRFLGDVALGEELPERVELLRFRTVEGGEVWVGWCPGNRPVQVELPRVAQAVFEVDGTVSAAQERGRVELDGSPRYLEMEPSSD